MNKITTTILAFALVATPAFALAEEVETSASASVETEVRTDASRPMYDDAVKMRLRASTSAEARAGKASTTAAMRAEKQQSLLERARERAKEEVERRTEKLEQMSERIDHMARLSDEDKAELKAELAEQVTVLASIAAKVDTDTGTSSLKASIQSITKSHRIFALVMPRAAINAAADRVLTVVAHMTALSAKLGERITAAQTAGKDVSVLVSARAELDTKVASAKTSAEAAVAAVANLKPDEGDKTIFAANEAALKDARGKIQSAQQDLVAAKKAAELVVKGLRGVSVKANVTATSSVEAE